MCKILPQGPSTISTPGKPNSENFIFRYFFGVGDHSGVAQGAARNRALSRVCVYGVNISIIRIKIVEQIVRRILTWIEYLFINIPSADLKGEVPSQGHGGAGLYRHWR